MNKRKPADYSTLYKNLDDLMARKMSETELCYEIGKAVSAALKSVRQSWPPSTCGSGILR